MNGFVSLTMAPVETKKNTFSVIIAMVAKREDECSFKKMNLIDMYYQWKKSWLDKPEVRKKCHDLKYVHFEKKDPEARKHIFLYVMTTFHNFALIKRKLAELKGWLGPFWKIEMFIGSSNNWSKES